MREILEIFVRLCVATLGAIVAFVVWVFMAGHMRLLGSLALVAFFAAVVNWLAFGSFRHVKRSAFFVLLLLSPVEISAVNKPGLPRLVPVQMGLPMRPPTEQEERDAYLGGCVVSGFEPFWILVW